MQKVTLYFLVLAWLTSPIMVIADTDARLATDEEICRAYAEQEKISEAEKEKYIKRCVRRFNLPEPVESDVNPPSVD